MHATDSLSALFDPFGIGAAFLQIQQSWLKHPAYSLHAMSELQRSLSEVGGYANTCLIDPNGPVCAAAVADDERFADPVWRENPALCTLMQTYLVYTRWLERSVYDSPEVPKKIRRRAAFWTRQWFNALAPSNALITNPVALKKSWENGGASLREGLKYLFEDAQNSELPMVDRSQFEVGRNVATTPGAVVFRNELLELIQYTPTQDKVHAVPILIVPPWINKFYILDLNEQKSMVNYLRQQGFTVFIISWKNPGADQADTTFEQYLLQGIQPAIEAARAICKAPTVHAVGYCIGGTALTTLMAWLNQAQPAEQMPVAHWTLFASLVDFSRPGDIDAFINEESVSTIERLMAQQGYLDGKQIGWAFRMLRPNSLIWHDYVHRYLLGEPLPAFDVLFWNADSTRLPRAMHSFCLRNFYLENRLARRHALTIGQQKIDLSRITQPLYLVGTREDHITPWRGTFHTASLVGCPVRYVLSTSGHILGIINPPGPKSKREYWAGDATGERDGEAWLKSQTRQPGSWWEDWTRWLAERCGPLQSPPPLGRAPYRKLADAPGSYVKA